jgi:hypothetical protein
MEMYELQYGLATALLVTRHLKTLSRLQISARAAPAKMLPRRIEDFIMTRKVSSKEIWKL